ncbi:MAG: hypothetical protein M0R06_15200 [Sphaerochaeta sp.]|jgi:hypothetical protein|nr:hypothetical protein [Sphaerochaeta sp.]
MTTYAPSSTTVGVSVGDGTTPTTNWLLPALLIGGGVAGAAVIISSKKKEKK